MDYFAALSLAYVVEHLYEINGSDTQRLLEMERRITQGEITPEVQQQRAAIQLAGKVVEASEAVAYAEHLRQLDIESNRRVSELNSKRASTGGKGRHKKYEALKPIVISYYDSQYSCYSNREAARLIYESELTDEQRYIFETDKPENTIAKWIGEQKKIQAAENIPK